MQEVQKSRITQDEITEDEINHERRNQSRKKNNNAIKTKSITEDEEPSRSLSSLELLFAHRSSIFALRTTKVSNSDNRTRGGKDNLAERCAL
jgi:hypothetical protein